MEKCKPGSRFSLHIFATDVDFSEKQIAMRDGRWFTVRIMPFRTMDNVIEGGVITFIDISVAKRLEAELRAAVTRCIGHANVPGAET